MKERVERLLNILNEGNVVFFTGAGASTASGIKDFRSDDGLYSQKFVTRKGIKMCPEDCLHRDFLYGDPTEFYRFYREKMNCLDYEPCIVHNTIANLEKKGLVSAVITQNIDGLHQKAGSSNVIELHGSCMINYCVKCGKQHDVQDVFYGKNKFPVCSECGHLVRPDVTLYGEQLSNGAMQRATEALGKASTCVVCGTSMTVYPAAGLINYFYGKNLIIINRDKVHNEEWADIVFHEDMVEVFKQLSI